MNLTQESFYTSSMVAIMRLKNAYSAHKLYEGKLTDEMEQGKVCLTCDSVGRLPRLVPVTVLRLDVLDGRVLVHMGSFWPSPRWRCW